MGKLLMTLGILLMISITWIFLLGVTEFLGGNLLVGAVVLLVTSALYFVFGLIVSAGYKKEYGTELFGTDSTTLSVPLGTGKEQDLIDQGKTVIDIDNSKTIKLKPQPKMGKTTTWVLIGLVVVFSAVFITNGGMEMPLRIVLIVLLILAFGNLLRSRMDFTPDLKAYSKTKMIGPIVYKHNWYQLPKITKISIENEIANQSGVVFAVKMGSYRTREYHLVLSFSGTNEVLYLTSSNDLEEAKSIKAKYASMIETPVGASL